MPQRPELSSSLSPRRLLDLPPPVVTMKGTAMPLEVIEEVVVVDVEDAEAKKEVTKDLLDNPEVLPDVDVEAKLKEVTRDPPVPLAEVSAEKSLETTTAATVDRKVTSSKTVPSPKKRDPKELKDQLVVVPVEVLVVLPENQKITLAEIANRKDIMLRIALNLKKRDPPVLLAEVSAEKEPLETTIAATVDRRVTSPKTALNLKRNNLNALPATTTVATADRKVTLLETAPNPRRKSPRELKELLACVLNVSASPSFATTATKKATSPVNAPRLKKRRRVMVKTSLLVRKSLIEKRKKLRISTRMTQLVKTTLLTVFAWPTKRLLSSFLLMYLREFLRKPQLPPPRLASTLLRLPFPRVRPMVLRLVLELNT